METRRLEKEIGRVEDVALEAKADAMAAKQEVSAHERECVIRYAAINQQLKAIPVLQKGINRIHLWAMFCAGLLIYTNFGAAILKFLKP